MHWIMPTHRDKRVLVAGSLFLVMAWAVWCAFLLAKGLDFTDAGLYSSDA